VSAREEAAAKAMVSTSVKRQTTDAGELARVALAAADVVMLSDATVERAARALWVSVGEKAEDWVYYPPEDERKVWLTNHARIALEAAVREETK
jgi:hypothetical protein